MKPRVCVFKAALLGSALTAIPTLALAENDRDHDRDHNRPTPICSDIATNPSWGLAGNPAITGLTAAIIPAGVGGFPPVMNAAYCEVDFTDVTLVGPEFGYLPGQTSKYRIRIGLPLNANDGGSGGVQGAWNGKIRTIGNGAFAGQVVGVTSATNGGYVGSGSDSGHNSSITHPVAWPGGPLPTTETPPSENGAVFALNPDGTVNYGRIMDYAYRSEHHANMWARKIGKIYYGMKHTRNYYTGCSDGGREGHELAERFGQNFDGLVALSPAVGHSLQQMVAGWANYMTNQELGTPGFDATKFTDVNARALAACDGIDGISDGMVEEHRACHYDANAAVCGQPGASADPTKCLTPTEASIVNRIWDGPRNPDGSKFWYGWEKGQAGLLGVTPSFFGPPFPDLFGEQLNRYWVHRNPFMDWRTISEAQFLTETRNLVTQFSPWLAGDNPNMSELKEHGGKLITAIGNADQVIPPDGFINFVQRVMAHEGGASKMQKFYRFYIFPGATHCAGSGMDIEKLFSTLVNWVENDIKPDHIVAQVNPTRTRKVCMYPNKQVYNGSGSTDDQANFHCQTHATDPFFETVSEHTAGPKKGNNDINHLPGFGDHDDD